MAHNRSDLATSSRHNPSFFMYYGTGPNPNAVLIPATYIKNFNGDMKTSHRRYHYKPRPGLVTRQQQGLLKTGFTLPEDGTHLCENSIKSGDHIVFTLLDNNVFSVRAYGPDGMGKQEFLETDDGRVFKAQFYKTMNGPLKNLVGVPESVRNQCDCRTSQDVKLVNEAGGSVIAKMKQLEDGRVVLGYGAVSDFWVISRVKRGHKLKFEVICRRESKAIKEIRMTICSL